MKSLTSTVLMELMPLSRLDMAAAKRAETTRPVRPAGRTAPMKWGNN